jgi:hypothetical protein
MFEYLQITKQCNVFFVSKWGASSQQFNLCFDLQISQFAILLTYFAFRKI